MFTVVSRFSSTLNCKEDKYVSTFKPESANVLALACTMVDGEGGPIEGTIIGADDTPGRF